MISPEIIADMVPGALGATLGGGGVAWLTKLLFSRVIQQYDKVLSQHAKRHESAAEKLAQAITRVAVLESHLEDARRLRIDLEQRFASCRGEYEAKLDVTKDEMNELRRDIYVAHERIRAICAGDMEISKIQAPPVVRRR